MLISNMKYSVFPGHKGTWPPIDIVAADMLDTGELAPSSSLRGVDIGAREQLEVIGGHKHNEEWPVAAQ